MRSLIHLVLFSFLTLPFNLFADATPSAKNDVKEDFELMKGRLRHIALGYKPDQNGTEMPDEQTLAAAKMILDEQNDDGSWDWIDYGSRRASGWPGYKHFFNLLPLCQVGCRLPQDSKQPGQYLDGTHRAIQFWKERNFRSDNWWPHEIYIPMVAGQLVLMLGDEASPAERDFLINEIMSASTIKSTGQNRIWLSTNVFVRSLLLNDFETATNAMDAVLKELKITTHEGLQPDWSYHQHGNQLQWGNYGLHYVEDMTKWLWLISGTQFETPEKVAIMRNYILNGQRWVIWKNFYDISGQGRQIRPNSTKIGGQIQLTSSNRKSKIISDHMAYMKAADPEFSAQYQALIDQVALRKDAKPLTGNKVYWRSDYMVHRTPDFMTSVKMNSAHLLGTESGGNSENMLGTYLSDGACFFYRSGKKYDEIFPVWNWRQIPGTTLLQSSKPIPVPGWKNPANMQPFAGGVSNGSSGCVAMDYKRDGLTARKAWFASGDLVMCLGTNITSGNPEPVDTTVDQCLLNAAVVVQDAKEIRKIETGTYRFNTVKSITHDGLVYSFPKPQSITLDCGRQTGNWKRILKSESDKAIQKNVFNLRINHGVSPKSAEYSYLVYPKSETTPEKSEILSNTEKTQAVRFETAIMAIFYEPTTLSWGQANAITVSCPCAIMLTQNKDKKYSYLSLSDPDRKHTTATLTINLDGHTYDKNMTFPSGEQAGSTIQESL